MSLSPGTSLGPFEVLARVGAGGMGEVYRARDTKLNRDVALKVLPEAFALDPERLARFRREAQVLASLNHTNIAAIHGLEESDPSTSSGQAAVQALVLEYVDGPTLADRIAQGAIPLEEALPIARQIAEALEAAHEQGIIHRDLKPANIKVRDDGTVKVLDFGLAKLVGAEDGAPDAVAGFSRPGATMSPTITTPAATMAGVILGTAAYMSPEQAKGRAADKRSDIWSFGCVLFEMLAGRRAFEAEDVSDTLAAVLRAEVPWDQLPRDLPPSVVTLLKGCLEKDRRQRIADIAVAQFVLAQYAGLTLPRVEVDDGRLRRRHVMSLVGAAVTTALVTAGIAWFLVPRSSSPPLVRFVHQLGEQDRLTGAARQQVVISPDGTQIVYVANNRLYRRAMGDLVSQAIPGTEKDNNVMGPVFSPDGQWIAYYGASSSENAIKRIPIVGGSATTIVQTTSNPWGMSWDDESGIVYSDGRSGIFRVGANSGTPEQLVHLEDGYAPWGPHVLPGGDAVLFTLIKTPPGVPFNRWNSAAVVVQSLKSGDRKTVVDGASDGRFLPSGHLVFAVSGSLFAVAFDPAALTSVGDRVQILTGVKRGANLVGAAHFSVSRNGSLVYFAGPVDAMVVSRTLHISDRNGNSHALKLEPRNYTHPRVSFDGSRLAVAIEDDDDADISIYELAETSALRRLTIEGQNRYPVWHPDGDRVAFQSDRERDLSIFWQSADGRSDAERLTTAGKDVSHVPESFSPDGRYLLYREFKAGMHTLHVLSMEDKKSVPFGDVSSPELTAAAFSPNGRWVAYAKSVGASDLFSPDRGIFIQPFPANGVPIPVPKRRIDYHPAWAPDGNTLFYVATATLPMVSVSVRTQPTVTFGVPAEVSPKVPRPSLQTGASRGYDVLPDGRLLIVSPEGDQDAAAREGLHVVVNWIEELKRLVPAR